MENYALGMKGRVEPTADTNEFDETFLIDILDHEPYLIHVGCNHDRKTSAFFYRDKISKPVF
ncbi:MAG: hypothetical protein BWY05_00833 [Euryarchaeota archaeon ADurb.Bin165]|nr:MAG: hypothetical protein BWY05_00833 [Euryarchaeota archaeon ADurb.Bin165]